LACYLASVPMELIATVKLMWVISLQSFRNFVEVAKYSLVEVVLRIPLDHLILLLVTIIVIKAGQVAMAKVGFVAEVVRNQDLRKSQEQACHLLSLVD
jgi:hypothetical protein